MRVVVAGLVLCLAAATLAVAAEPVVSFEERAAVAGGVTPGGSVAWLVAGRTMEDLASVMFVERELLADDDRDGGVRWELPLSVPARSVWAAVDVASGDFTLASPSGEVAALPFPGEALGQGVQGRLNRFEREGRMLQVLVVRPGTGAWSLRLGDGGAADEDGEPNGRLRFELDSLQPLGGSPEPPDRFAAGDVVVLIDPERLEVFAAKLTPPGQSQGGAVTVRRLPLAAVLTFLSAAVPPAMAESQHPNLERGFHAEKSYQVGQVDHVNLFNGNLVLTIPIGPVHRVGGKLSYGLSLVYNGKAWDWTQTATSTATFSLAEANRDANAGFGWLLTLGALVPPHTPPRNDTHLWLYVSPDGAQHLFHPTLHEGETPSPNATAPTVFYTRDGTYLRMKVVGGGRRVEFPDGTSHRFDGSHRLVEMRDPFGNFMTVTYLADHWRLDDSAGRLHQVYFRTVTMDGRQVPVVDRMELAGFGGAVAVWRLEYETGPQREDGTFFGVSVERPFPHDDIEAGFGPTARVTLLTAVVLPDGSRWSIPVSDYYLFRFEGLRLPGLIKGLTLPTLGRLEWDYTNYQFSTGADPPQPGERSSPKAFHAASAGVSARRTKDAFGTVEGTWTYVPSLVLPAGFPSEQPVEQTTTVTTPLGHSTKHYFHAYSGGPTSTAAESGDYGLPFSIARPDPAGGGRSLSTETFHRTRGLQRSTYVRYEGDASSILVPGVGNGGNRREAASRTVFHDDANRFLQVDRSSFDGLGHYRWTTVGGNLPGAARTVGVNVNPGSREYTADPATSTFVLPAPSGPWMLEGAAWRQETEGTSTAFRTFCYDPASGFVGRERIYRNDGVAESPNDVVVGYGHDGLGNVSTEQYHGGDVEVLPTGVNGCVVGLPSPQYRIDHAWQFGALASSQYVDGATGVAFPFKSADRTLDRNTGLPASSRDVSGLETSYEYDLLGRVTWEKPAAGHGAWTEHVYTPASLAAPPPELAGLGWSPARVTIRQRANGSKTGAVLAESMVVFDALGRVFRELQRLPNGTWSTRQTTYNQEGLKATVSEPGSLAKVTSFSGYDPFGRPGTITPPDGAAHAVTLTYAGVRTVTRTVKVGTSRDAAGNVVEANAATTEVYDRHGRLVRVTEPSGPGGATVGTDYGYDVGGRLTSVRTTASEGTQNRLFAYDKRGFLTSETHPEKGPSGNGTVHSFDYDARGHARRRRDGGVGSPFDETFQYDKAEQLTLVRETGSPFRPFKAFTYAASNAAGNPKLGKVEVAESLTYVTIGDTPFTGLVRETFTYGGKAGRPSFRTIQNFINGNLSDQFTKSVTYTDLGDLARVDQPQCSLCTAPAPRSVTNTYANGFLTAVSGYAPSITYHPNGMVHQVTHANGVVDTWAVDPDGLRRPGSITATHNGVQRWASGAYAFDGAGNVTKIGSSWFLYDRVSRLVTGTVFDGPLGGGTQKQQTYAFDTFGNLQSIGGVNGRATPTSSATNRLTGAGVTYDAAGHLTAWNGQTYEYDRAGRTIRTTSATQEWVHLYAADDERLWSFQVAGGTTNRWTLRGFDGKVLREYWYDRTTGAWTVDHDYIYRDGQLLAAETSQGRRDFHLDHLGTPRLITDLFGQPAAYHVYFPFGEEATAPSQDRERMKFTGHERDLNDLAGPGDDLDYMHARFYSPVTGRFMSVDPVNSAKPPQPQSWNKYIYARSNPLRRIDPDGSSDLHALAYAEEQAELYSSLTPDERDTIVAAQGATLLGFASLFVPGPEDFVLGAMAGRGGLKLLSSLLRKSDGIELPAQLGPMGDAGAQGLTRMERFRSLQETGFQVGKSRFTLNEHVMNSLRKSGRRHIDPESMARALENVSSPGAKGTSVFTDPETGTRFFVNEANEVVGVHPAEFR